MRCSAQSYLRLVVSFCSTINSFFLAAKLCIHKFFCCVWHFNWFFGPNVLGFQWLKLPLPARMLESPKIRSTSSVFVGLGSQQRRLTCGCSAISFDRLPLHQLNYHLLHCFAFMFHLCYPFPHSAGEPKRHVLFVLPGAHSHSPHILQALTSSHRRLCPPKLLPSCSHLCSPAPSSTRRLLLGGSHFFLPLLKLPTKVRLPPLPQPDCRSGPPLRCTPTLCFHYRHHQKMT